MKNILVTGGAGYIGSHTSKLLALSGYNPITFDNLSTGRKEAVRYGPLVKGNLADASLLREALRRYRIEAVMHFASSAYVGESIDNPRKYFSNNVANSLNLLNVMIDSGIRHIVFSSTCATYGHSRTLPITEDHPQCPVNPYGESKLFVERMLRWYGEAYGLNWCALRYFNAAGADPDGELGELHNPETHLIPLVMQAALGVKQSVPVYGNDYDTPDGTAVRDYIHVTDLASAHVAALKHLFNRENNMVLNLGTGKGHSVREIIRTVERVGMFPVRVKQMPRRTGDPAILVANAGKARELLGWEPRFSDLETIVSTAWHWETNWRSMQQAAAG